MPKPTDERIRNAAKGYWQDAEHDCESDDDAVIHRVEDGA